jgi:2-amino-4-hydroxy-6-hydroxymethyldihydropteridine diphosphokinase
MTESFHVAFLGLGSNIGEREALLIDALRQLHNHPDIQITKRSAMYETDPVGYTDQPPFLNMACRIETTLSSNALLEQVLRVERGLGRERLIRWGPRTIDIDVLLYDNLHITTPTLTVPHPRIMERAFVLVPLLDVLGEKERDWRPGFTKVEVAATGVRPWTKTSWPEEYGPSEN